MQRVYLELQRLHRLEHLYPQAHLVEVVVRVRALVRPPLPLQALHLVRQHSLAQQDLLLELSHHLEQNQVKKHFSPNCEEYSWLAYCEPPQISNQIFL